MIEQTTVDGVPTLFAPTAGPLRAGLTFRVGRADETLARSGITHLIEHLALFHLNMADYHFNGSTGPVSTDFHLQGSGSDIAAFLSGVCAALHNLPMHRLEVEKEILRTEHNSRSTSVLQPFPLWRYGARGYGLLSYPEWGLPMFGPDDLRAWVARYFTKDNVVLWVAGPEIPANLSLRLPAGTRQPLPVVTSALPQTPAFFYGEGTAVAFEAIMQRRTAGNVFAGVLERELFRALRQENGLSYTAAANYEPRGDGAARIVALADALPEKQHAVLGGFVDVLAKLRVGRIDPADLSAAVAKAEDSFERPDADAERVPGAAFNLVTGYPNRTLEELRAELHAVTVADLRAIAQEISATALLMTPEDTAGAEWAGYTPAPTRSATVVVGTRYPYRNQENVALVIGPDGASIDAPNGLATVRFAECAALLIYPDGARHLIGDDGIGVRIEPTLIEIDPSALAIIDATVSRATHTLQAPRDPAAIPQPRAKPAPAAAPVAASVKRPGWETAVMIIVAVAALAFGCGSALATIGVGTSTDGTASDGGVWAVVGCGWFVTILLVLPVILLFRRRKRAA